VTALPRLKSNLGSPTFPAAPSNSVATDDFIPAAVQQATPSSASSTPSSPVVFFRPSAAAKVTNLWFGSESPLVEVLDINVVEMPQPRPPPPTLIVSPTTQHHHEQHLTMASNESFISPPATVPQLVNSAQSFASSPFLSSARGLGGGGAAASTKSGSTDSLAMLSSRAGDSMTSFRKAPPLPPASVTSPVTAAAPADASAASPPPTLVDAALGPRGAIQLRVHICNNSDAGFEIATEAKIDVAIGGPSCSISVALPVVVTISNFQFDVVLLVTIRPGSGGTMMSVEIEGDRFGASAAETADRILSSMSVLVKIGDVGGSPPLVDADHIRGLALREIRALLAQVVAGK
jgi:hypothetical protein